MSSTPKGRTYPIAATHGIADIVLDNKSYSKLLAEDSRESHPAPKPTIEQVATTQEIDGSLPSQRKPPAISIADLVLDDVTYDAILSSAAKGLHHSSESQRPPPTPPLADDARTPPNSPTSGPWNQSLVSVSADIMTREGVKRSGGADGREL
ncbi:hypothetical protein D9615_008962 [Tricholomella constricta]|uniref:Uncharacterized protein n=1 Tax=Tricholomella constricta TaxID=117010 RepID=A0A8H5LZ45_9AGAR|nr:hypothetical protein D9615_008962 [Tricholomella constricta]